MKKLQQLCIAGVFTLVLTITAFAGHIQTPGVTQPPPDESSPTTLVGIETEPGVQNPEAISGSVTDIALDLLQTMLSVF